MNVFERLSRAAQARPLSPSLVVGVAAFVAAGRVLAERFVVFAGQPTTRASWPWFLQTVSFYLALLLVLAGALRAVGRTTPRAALGLVSMGLVFGIAPPLVDALFSPSGSFTYEFRPSPSQVPWSLYEPRRGLPLGEAVVLWSAIALMAASVWRASRSVPRAALAALLTWVLVFVFLVGVPTLAQRLSAATGLAPSEYRGLALIVAAQAGLVTVLGLWRRALERLPQVLLPVLFVLLGAALTGTVGAPAALVAVHAAVFGLGFSLSNDWHDRREDEAQGRPATTLDETTAALLMLVPVVGAAQVVSGRLESGLCLVGFAVVANAWQADPLRLKCVFPLSYKTEAFLAGLCALAGLAADPGQPVRSSDLLVVAAIALGTPVALVFKDLKDVTGDSAAGVRTAFVVASERGLSAQTMRTVAALGLLGALVTGAVFLVTRGAPATVGLAVVALALAAAACVRFMPSAHRAVTWGIVLAEACLVAAVIALLTTG